MKELPVGLREPDDYYFCLFDNSLNYNSFLEALK